jgi:putative (di)nucleoside polyphosphate hydrolase
MRVEDLPYRPCVGVVLFNRDGRAFIGRRIDGPEHVDLKHSWQMPQAAVRELREETNVRSIERLGEIGEWLRYDIPRELIGQAWKGKYRGQMQKWFAMRFTGEESEINVEHPDGAHEAEFAAWRWEALAKIPRLIVPFKRAVYERVVAEFAKYAT